MTTVAPPRVTEMTEAELGEVIAWGDDDARAGAIAELDRRDAQRRRAGRAREGQRARHSEWETVARANFAAAEEYCRGDANMLTRAAAARGVTAWSLWHGAEDLARRNASQELLTFWDYAQSRPPPPMEYEKHARGSETGMGGYGEVNAAGSVNGEPARVNAGAGGWRERHEMNTAENAAAFAGLRARAAAIAGAPDPATAPVTGEVVLPSAGHAATAQGRAPQFMRRTERVDGADALRQAYAFAERCGLWPNPHALATGAVWAAKCHGKARATDPDIEGAPVLPVWPYDPRLFFTSTEGGSGKTRLNKSIAMMCPSPVSLVEASKASFVDFIGQQKTVIITELDNWVGNGGRNRWLLGIGNAGYERGHSTSRKVGGKSVQTYLMCPVILDGLASVIHSTGMELRTFISRAIIVWVEKAPGDYRAPRISRDVQELGKWIRDRLGAWMAQEVADGIGDDVPDMTGLPGNRPGALWEPLCMVADRAGEEWPEMIRDACLRLESPGGGNDATAAERIQHGLARLQAQLNGGQADTGEDFDFTS